MIRALFAFLLFSLQFVRAEIPELFKKKEFTAAEFATAVNWFVALGEEEAVKQMQEIAKMRVIEEESSFMARYRVGWMCRVLFEPKEVERLRQPHWGGLTLPWRTMPAKSWPLYPVAQSGSSYFVLAEGYFGTGIPETLEKYLEYCRKVGSFRKQPVTVPDAAQATKDADALKASDAWKAIKWTDSGHNWSCKIPESGVWDNIVKQATKIPAPEKEPAPAKKNPAEDKK